MRIVFLGRGSQSRGSKTSQPRGSQEKRGSQQDQPGSRRGSKRGSQSAEAPPAAEGEAWDIYYTFDAKLIFTFF